MLFILEWIGIISAVSNLRFEGVRLPVWRNVFKHMLRALLPVAIIPGLVGALIFSYLGLTADTVLAVVMLAQFYIVWIQVEVALRQVKLTEFAYEPVLVAKLDTITLSPGSTAFHVIRFRNIGRYPAHDVYTQISVSALQPVQGTFQVIGTIEPEKEQTIEVPEEKVKDYSEFSLEVHYVNILGQDGELTFTFSRKYMLRAITIGGRTKPPGVLLNSIEDLRMLYLLLRREVLVNARTLLLVVIGGATITLLTGLFSNSPPTLVGAAYYGHPFPWLSWLAIAPQYLPLRITIPNLMADIIFWAFPVGVALLILQKARKDRGLTTGALK